MGLSVTSGISPIYTFCWRKSADKSGADYSMPSHSHMSWSARKVIEGLGYKCWEEAAAFFAIMLRFSSHFPGVWQGRTPQHQQGNHQKSSSFFPAFTPWPLSVEGLSTGEKETLDGLVE